VQQLTIRDFLHKQWNPRQPKECRIHSIAQTRLSTKWRLPLWLSERDTSRDIVHYKPRSGLCDPANFLWKSGNGTVKWVHKQDHEIVVGDEKGWRTPCQIIKKESNYRYHVRNFNVGEEFFDSQYWRCDHEKSEPPR
jgi:hypothetical protein